MLQRMLRSQKVDLEVAAGEVTQRQHRLHGGHARAGNQNTMHAANRRAPPRPAHPRPPVAFARRTTERSRSTAAWRSAPHSGARSVVLRIGLRIEADGGSPAEREARDMTHVLITGAGMAAVECTLALRALAGPGTAIELLAPAPELVHRPSSVRTPFGGEPAPRVSRSTASRPTSASACIATRWRRSRPSGTASSPATATTSRTGSSSWPSAPIRARRCRAP